MHFLIHIKFCIFRKSWNSKESYIIEIRVHESVTTHALLYKFGKVLKSLQ